MTITCDALVLGAGIVGAACARALARAGLDVRVVDPNPIGSGATAAGMGHLVVIDEPEAEFALTLRSRALWDELCAELPRAAEHDRVGTLWVATDAQELELARDKHARLCARGVAAELLDARAAHEAEPSLREEILGALLVPGDGVVYPPPVARSWLEQSGVVEDRWIPGRRALRIEPNAVRLDDGSSISAGCVVVATGLAARELVTGLPLRARKGHLLITDRHPGFCRHQIVELGYVKNAHGHASESIAFNVQPRPNGQVLVGSSRQFDVEDTLVEPRMLSRILARAIEFLPALAGLQALRAWTGLRAATPDGVPILGPLPAHPGTLLAVGHEGLGITTSLASAEIIVAHVLGHAPPIAAEAYLPARFASLRHG